MQHLKWSGLTDNYSYCVHRYDEWPNIELSRYCTHSWNQVVWLRNTSNYCVHRAHMCTILTVQVCANLNIYISIVAPGLVYRFVIYPRSTLLYCTASAPLYIPHFGWVSQNKGENYCFGLKPLSESCSATTFNPWENPFSSTPQSKGTHLADFHGPYPGTVWAQPPTPCILSPVSTARKPTYNFPLFLNGDPAWISLPYSL